MQAVGVAHSRQDGFFGKAFRNVAWSYPHPSPEFAALAGYLALYAALFDTVLVDGEQVIRRPGGFYRGWITSLVAGPFKGGFGSTFW